MQMDNDRMLTVVITTRNKAALLREALDSVLSAEISLLPTDIIVADDASTDGTPDVAREYGVRYTRVQSGTCAGTRNAGLALVDTEFVTVLDDDDRWLPGNMQPQLDALMRNPAAAYAYGKVQPTDHNLVPDGEPLPNPPPGMDPVERAIYDTAQIGVVLFRTAAIIAAGGFDEAIRYTEDKDLQVRLALHHPVEEVDIVGVLYRLRYWSPSDADYNWIKAGDLPRMHRKWRAAGMKRSMLAKAAIKARGTLSYHTCRSACLALAHGDRSVAFRELGHALRISPVHCVVRHHSFWWTVRALLFPSSVASQLRLDTRTFW
jgi:glycosyltransferase involved in cell wall biosynthesis